MRKTAALALICTLWLCGCQAAKRIEVIESSPDASEGFIPVTGGRVWYRIVGPGKPGVPLLVLHGGPGMPHDYLEPLAALADNRPVVFYDQLGCGRSDAPDDPSLYTLRRYVDEVDQVRHALKLRRLYILGQSWGSMLAVEYLAAKGSDGVAGLVLSAPFLNAKRFAADQREYLSMLPPATRQTIEEKEASKDYASTEYQQAAMVFYKKHVCRLDPWPDCLIRAVDKLSMRVYEQMWGPSEFTATGSLKNADATGKLRFLSLPVLYTCGRHDESSPLTAAFYQSLTKGSELIVFENASHMHHLERQADYLDAVGEFLSRDRGKPKSMIRGME